MCLERVIYFLIIFVKASHFVTMFSQLSLSKAWGLIPSVAYYTDLLLLFGCPPAGG